MDDYIKTVGLSTYENIKKDIIFGVLPPLKKLKLKELTKTYNASISTLREILSRLAGDGFVLSEEQKGFCVSPVSKTDLYEIANLRILIESHALKKSIENSNTEWEAELLSAHHKLKVYENNMLNEKFNNKNDWKTNDSEFHQTLVKNCRSENLVKLHKLIFDKYLRYQFLVLTFRGENSILEHQKLLDFTLEKNYLKAQKVLEEHIYRGLYNTVLDSDTY